ncbi:hypothetical protein LUZ60_009692 [Juncus effusus]|nr:hypothetical protein LUZ60_009692 [Juncus effusus]
MARYLVLFILSLLVFVSSTTEGVNGNCTYGVKIRTSPYSPPTIMDNIYLGIRNLNNYSVSFGNINNPRGMFQSGSKVHFSLYGSCVYGAICKVGLSQEGTSPRWFPERVDISEAILPNQPVIFHTFYFPRPLYYNGAWKDSGYCP